MWRLLLFVNLRQALGLYLYFNQSSLFGLSDRTNVVVSLLQGISSLNDISPVTILTDTFIFAKANGTCALYQIPTRLTNTSSMRPMSSIAPQDQLLCARNATTPSLRNGRLYVETIVAKYNSSCYSFACDMRSYVPTSCLSASETDYGDVNVTHSGGKMNVSNYDSGLWATDTDDVPRPMIVGGRTFNIRVTSGDFRIRRVGNHYPDGLCWNTTFTTNETILMRPFVKYVQLSSDKVLLFRTAQNMTLWDGESIKEFSDVLSDSIFNFDIPPYEYNGNVKFASIRSFPITNTTVSVQYSVCTGLKLKCNFSTLNVSTTTWTFTLSLVKFDMDLETFYFAVDGSLYSMNSTNITSLNKTIPAKSIRVPVASLTPLRASLPCSAPLPCTVYGQSVWLGSYLAGDLYTTSNTSSAFPPPFDAPSPAPFPSIPPSSIAICGDGVLTPGEDCDFVEYTTYNSTSGTIKTSRSVAYSDNQTCFYNGYRECDLQCSNCRSARTKLADPFLTTPSRSGYLCPNQTAGALAYRCFQSRGFSTTVCVYSWFSIDCYLSAGCSITPEFTSECQRFRSVCGSTSGYACDTGSPMIASPVPVSVPVSAPVPVRMPACGDGLLDTGEQCEVTSLGTTFVSSQPTCVDLGYANGSISCVGCKGVPNCYDSYLMRDNGGLFCPTETASRLSSCFSAGVRGCNDDCCRFNLATRCHVSLGCPTDSRFVAECQRQYRTSCQFYECTTVLIALSSNRVQPPKNGQSVLPAFAGMVTAAVLVTIGVIYVTVRHRRVMARNTEMDEGEDCEASAMIKDNQEEEEGDEDGEQSETAKAETDEVEEANDMYTSSEK